MSFSDILKKCLNYQDEIRNQGEFELDNRAQNSFPTLLEECSAELANENSPKEYRQLCATIIKNMIHPSGRHNGKWEQMNTDTKLNIKNSVLACLASEIKEVRKAAAMTVAGICLIEVPRGEWPQIIQLLISITSNENLNCRLASITTIGYISQELSPGHLSTTEVDQILSALINNMTLDTDLEIIKHATLSFLNFLFFARKNMEKPDERNYIFNTIFNLLSHNNIDVRICAMQCLVEVSRIYYAYLESHIDALVGITEHHMLNDDERVSIQAYEFWCSVSDEEIKSLMQTGKCNCYCDRVLDKLFTIIKFHLMNRNAEQEKLNDDSWSNVKAASCLLTNLSLCTNDKLVSHVFDLIQDNLSSENPKNRDSTILAFGSILETTHKDQLKTILPGAIPIILGMLEDKNNEVRYTVSWCIKKITELHSDSITDVNLYNTFMTSLIQNFYNNSKRVVVHILDAINNLVTNLKPDTSIGQTSGYVSGYMAQLLELLLKVAFEKDAYDPNNNIALGAFFTMGSLIDYAPLDTYHIINSFFYHILSAFESTLNQKNFSSKEMMYSYQTYIATVISACTAGEKVKINKDDAKSVYEYIKQSFIERQGVYEEGLMACSSIALLLKEDFMDIIPDFGMYLNLGLREWSEVSLCRIAINSTSDLIRSMGESMNLYLEQIYPNILAILENPESDKYLKTQAFIVVSDMFCFARQLAITNYNRITFILGNALAVAAMPQNINEDPEIIEYYHSLREHILECYSCIIHCLKDNGQMEHFEQNARELLTFIATISNPEYDPGYEQCADCLGIIGDLCDAYGSNIKGMLNEKALNYLIKKLKSSGLKKYETIIEWSVSVNSYF